MFCYFYCVLSGTALKGNDMMLQCNKVNEIRYEEKENFKTVLEFFHQKTCHKEQTRKLRKCSEKNLCFLSIIFAFSFFCVNMKMI